MPKQLAPKKKTSNSNTTAQIKLLKSPAAKAKLSAALKTRGKKK